MPAERTVIMIGIAWLVVLAVGGYFYATNLVLYQRSDSESFALRSSAFSEGEMMPAQYTCDGSEVAPPLEIQGVPKGTQSLVLVMMDTDVPRQLQQDGTFIHWVVYDIPTDVREIASGLPFGVVGKNETGKIGYAPPCPPPRYSPALHRYVFSLSALDTKIALAEGAALDEVREAIRGHVIAETSLMGVYERPTQ